jgi:hypothetical protein
MTQEQDLTRGLVVDQEHERAIERHCDLLRQTHSRRDDCRGCCRLCTLLIHRYERLMIDLVDA